MANFVAFLVQRGKIKNKFRRNNLVDKVKPYAPFKRENICEFVKRVIAAQPHEEPLRIVEQLVKIVMDELKSRPYQVSAVASARSLTVMLRHEGMPINERIVEQMANHTDRVCYLPDYSVDGNDGNDGWILTIQRDVPPIYVNHP